MDQQKRSTSTVLGKVLLFINHLSDDSGVTVESADVLIQVGIMRLILGLIVQVEVEADELVLDGIQLGIVSIAIIGQPIEHLLLFCKLFPIVLKLRIGMGSKKQAAYIEDIKEALWSYLLYYYHLPHSEV